MEKKFRGQRIDGKGWVYGDLIHQGDRTLIHKSTDEWKMFGIEEESEIVIPKTVGQFTGIKDKNGEDVYGGDVVIWPHINSEGKHEIYFDVEDLQYSARPLTDHNDYDLCLDSTHMEIIGNIHDKK